MATKHTCTTFTDINGREFNVIQTKANNIQIVNFGEAKKIKDTDYYGMNASYFNTATLEILNAAYQNGVPQGSGAGANDGRQNEVGTSLIYWNGVTLNYADNVTLPSAVQRPTTSGAWAQGGFGLFLCDRSWQDKLQAQAGYSESDLGGGSARTGILINTYSKDVCLFMSRILSNEIYHLRSAMMEYAGLTEGGSSGYWKAIMLDGGRSAQIRGEGMSSAVAVLPRGVPQIIALKDKT